MIRKASAVWNGGLKDGKGKVSSGSGGLKDVQYSFHTRFEDGVGVNPEELIAVAHASCFSMALSNQLGEKGITAESIETTASVTFEDLTLKKSVLTTTVTAPGADKALVEQSAHEAEKNCPISRVLNLEIELELTVVN